MNSVRFLLSVQKHATFPKIKKTKLLQGDILLILSFFTLMTLFQTHDAKPVLSFERPSAVSKTYLAQPHGIAFDQKGRLFAVDAKQGQVFFWNERGRFIGSFAKKGQGPGELQYPTCIAISGDQVWVTDSTQKLHIFSTRGSFIKSVALKKHARVLKAVSTNQALIGSRALNPRDNRNTMEFSLVNLETGTHKSLKRWNNDTVVRVENGNWRWRAFGADIDAQNLENKGVIFGFSSNSTLYQISPDGRVQEHLNFNLSQSKPNKSEQSFIKSMSFPGNGGKRFTLGKNTNWIWDFSEPKAPYTHFLVGKEQLLLVLMPLGSINGVGGGFSQGSYAVVNPQSGKTTNTGRFNFPQDSLIFFEDGRIVGFILNEEGDFNIQELAFKGFQ